MAISRVGGDAVSGCAGGSSRVTDRLSSPACPPVRPASRARAGVGTALLDVALGESVRAGSSRPRGRRCSRDAIRLYDESAAGGCWRCTRGADLHLLRRTADPASVPSRLDRLGLLVGPRSGKVGPWRRAPSGVSPAREHRGGVCPTWSRCRRRRLHRAARGKPPERGCSWRWEALRPTSSSTAGHEDTYWLRVWALRGLLWSWEDRASTRSAKPWAMTPGEFARWLQGRGAESAGRCSAGCG